MQLLKRLRFRTRRFSGPLLAVLVAASGCQVVRLPPPIRSLPGEWAVAGSNLGRNPFSPVNLAPPLVAAWDYGSNAAFGPGGPVVLSGHLLFGNRKGEVHAVRLETGRKGGLVDFKQPVEGSVVVGGDRLFVTTAWGSRTVQAYDLGRGRRIWSVKGEPVDAGPVLVRDFLVVASTDGRLRALHADDGTEAWTIPSAGAGISASLVSSEDGRVFVADEDGRIRCVRAVDGSVLWTAFAGAPVYEAPTLAGGELYVSTTRGRLIRLNAGTGREEWRVDLGAPTVRLTPATVAPDRVFVGATDGRVRAFERSGGAVLWDAELDDGASNQPLVTGSTLWIGTMGRDLVAIDTGSGALLWSVELPGRTKSTMALHRGGILVLAEPRNVLYFIPTKGDDGDR